MNFRPLVPAAAVATLAATPPAMAHTGVGDTQGFMHPLTGVDHIAAMVAVGMSVSPYAARGGGGAMALAGVSLLAGRL
jgi:urease accessory protein